MKWGILTEVTDSSPEYKFEEKKKKIAEIVKCLSIAEEKMFIFLGH